MKDTLVFQRPFDPQDRAHGAMDAWDDEEWPMDANPVATDRSWDDGPDDEDDFDDDDTPLEETGE